MRNRNTLILFAKSAQLCRVKTRMWPELSHRECLYLHRQSTQHFIRLLSSSNKFKFVLYATSSKKRDFSFSNIEIKTQNGIDLGARMHNAIEKELHHTERVIVIGSDCLELSPAYIESAFTMLSSKQDVVLGPANDGGYALIGMRKACAALFRQMQWGSSNVLAATLQKAESLGINTHLLDPLIDVDDRNDLLELYSKNRLPPWALPLLHMH